MSWPARCGFADAGQITTLAADHFYQDRIVFTAITPYQCIVVTAGKNFPTGKLYTNPFYALLDQHLAASGYAVIPTTSPLVARRSYWTVVSTLESVGLKAAFYHANVPSFGEWGFVVASRTLQSIRTSGQAAC